MLNEPSSLANVVYLIGDTLNGEYGVDPVPVYRQLGIDPERPADAGARQSNSVVRQMWDLAFEASGGDPAFGIKVGRRSGPGKYFVLGHAWMASPTLADAINSLIRYEDIIDSGITDIQFENLGDIYVLSETYPNPADHPGQLSIESSIATLDIMCRVALGRPVMPVKFELMWSGDHPDIYAGLVGGPIDFNAERNAIHYRAEDLEAPLAGSIPDVVDATTQIAERYRDSLDTSKIAHQVREILVQKLPSGSVDQDIVASMLHRSSSTLQRQLSAEGTSYRDVLENTRRTLAEAYLAEQKHTQAQIAFLVGFSDQSNFARAFKRWTGTSPGQFQKSAAAGG
ncbi:MAG: AraC family transcriptional regulator [Woeseiaceae bacterium]|nr:AraC family transcriptional regulator [Woeseiaceae bacterium]